MQKREARRKTPGSSAALSKHIRLILCPMIYGSTLFPHAEAAENGMDQFIIHGIARDFPHRFPGFREIDDDEVRLKTLTDGRSRAENIVQRFPYQFHVAKIGQEEDTTRVGILLFGDLPQLFPQFVHPAPVTGRKKNYRDMSRDFPYIFRLDFRREVIFI